ncbi:MAG: cyclic nucleotide-binding domain-containing protein, partial [Actinomycetota bacterium]
GLAPCSLAAGEVLFEEGDPGDAAYVITGGEIEIVKSSRGSEVRIATSGPGVIVGEMSLLVDEPRTATARALVDTELVSIPRASLDELLASDAHAVHALFSVFIDRWREQQSRMRQSEHMAHIGVLSAGLAHEMNNPAAAVTRGSSLLPAAIERQIAADAALPPGAVIPNASSTASASSPVELAEIEDGLETALEDLGVVDAWQCAPTLAEAGYTDRDVAGLDTESGATIVEAIAARSEVDALIAEVAEGSKRLSELVAAMKGYSYLDQAPVQDVDVTKGIDDTLLILKSKTSGISIERDHEADLPHITAHGSQLNQVWTNLIDNAADAIRDAGIDDGRITIRASQERDCIVVDVENGGPSIPPEIRDRIFEAFFTTKPPGQGTGLGLDTVWDVVVNQHRGEIDVESDDGRTVFRVCLPIEPPNGTA